MLVVLQTNKFFAQHVLVTIDAVYCQHGILGAVEVEKQCEVAVVWVGTYAAVENLVRIIKVGDILLFGTGQIAYVQIFCYSGYASFVVACKLDFVSGKSSR